MKKRRKVQVHVESLAESGQRFIDAWKRAARGKRVREEHLSFESEASKEASDGLATFSEWKSKNDGRAYRKL